MFDQLVMLLSFVFAIALTHLLACANELILARSRVRFCGLHAVWMVIALSNLTGNWLVMWSMHGVTHWSLFRVLVLFGTAIVQYFTCSTLALRVPEEGPVDMVAYFAKQRPVIFAAYGGLFVFAMLENYVFRDIDFLGPNAWLSEDAVILVSALPLGIAAFARPRWLQWLGSLTVLVMSTYFLVSFTVPA